ncbi:hypothetical protein LOTGIDRAFT_174451 [Lottia gigantea]|uniref:Ig-like domain-containing protein n=1 Tax=Lottia gigantea TaxID=225164 RepID=V4C8F5_LOTGI|nr:hypothetical protein LOTGIDRAFT_174451 [Lottia gigantea]ESO98014.1 hypothetical protein LOTGIDRAFT_174451 [Lottia gigantea]
MTNISNIKKKTYLIKQMKTLAGGCKFDEISANYAGRNGPEVSVSSVETNIKENESLRINGTVISNPPTNDIVWYQSNGNIVPNQFVVNSGANRRDLVINDINRNKSDNYTCTARLDLHPTVGDILQQTHSQSSTINVQYFDDIVMTTNKTKLKENDAVFIRCTVDSNPPASIKLFKDGDVELTTTNSNIYLISSTSCLDTGNYSCLATNPVYENQKTKSSELLVQYINSLHAEHTRMYLANCSIKEPLKKICI